MQTRAGNPGSASGLVAEAVLARHRIRAGRGPAHTSGLAAGFVQGNLVSVPREHAADFAEFCCRNPRPCPVLAVSEPGSHELPELARDLDLRRDLPRYRVFRYGLIVSEPGEVMAEWRDDLVTFVLGCSFSFEPALLAAGLRLRHVEQGRNVAMYRTRVDTAPAGPFEGPLVVSMRPLPASDVKSAIAVTAALPSCHGAPVHAGDPGVLGIQSLERSDFGEPVEVRPGEVPVFWACGVTALEAVERARLPFCITHAPGAMLITDLVLRAAS